MISTAYKCRFCGKAGIAWASDDSNPEWNTVFAAMLSCNNCADFRRKYVRYRNAIEHLCLQIVTARKTKSPEKAREFEDKAQLGLENFTKSFSHVVCKHHAIVDCWDEGFVTLLMDRPDKAGLILADFQDRIKNERLDYDQKQKETAVED